jgi:hypothetical protein
MVAPERLVTRPESADPAASAPGRAVLTHRNILGRSRSLRSRGVAVTAAVLRLRG